MGNMFSEGCVVRDVFGLPAIPALPGSCPQLSDILSRIRRGARILALFVSAMQPFSSISSRMMWTLSKLNII